MDVDLGRTPPVAQAALRWVEDLAHRVRMSLIRRRSMADPVAVLIRSHRRVHSNG